MPTYREQLRDLAADRHGLVTTADAVDEGVPPVELRKLAARGALERLGHGLYRVSDLPTGRDDQYAEAVQLVGVDAYLTHDAVLALHGLGLVNPRRIRVGTPRRVRTRLPRFVEVVQRPDLPEAAIAVYDGIRSTTVAQALLDCRSIVPPSRLAAAAVQARREGLITDKELRRLRPRLRKAERRPGAVG